MTRNGGIDIIVKNEALPIKPRRSSFNRWFWESLAEGILETTACSACGRLVFPPRPDCPSCLKREMHWRQLSGSGLLYSKTVVRVVPERLITNAPLAVGIVDLQENLRLVCALQAADDMAIGAPIKMVALKYLDGVLFGAAPA